MGGGVSIETSQVDLAAHVTALGNAYEPYAKAITDNGIDGKMLLDYENVDTLLTDLSLDANGLHKKKLNAEFQVRSAPCSKMFLQYYIHLPRFLTITVTLTYLNICIPNSHFHQTIKSAAQNPSHTGTRYVLCFYISYISIITLIQL